MNLKAHFTLGGSGLRVSRLALGTMTFGTEWGWGADEIAARQLFDRYLEAGGNFLDTADLYTNGTSERWIGKFVADTKSRDRVVIATKFTFNGDPGNPNGGGNNRKHMMAALEGSLRRLGTDYVDLYLMHAWDRFTPVEEVIRGLDDLVREGKVRYIGLSDVPAWYASRAQTLAELRGYERIAALQLEYSLVERNIEDEFVPLGIAHGMGIMVWSPLGSGLLSGKYKSSRGGAEGSGSGRLEALKGTTNPGFMKFNGRNWTIVGELERVAGELGRSMAQVALNCTANRPGIGSVILGATKLGQLEDNLKSLEFEIPGELRKRLDEVSAPPARFPYTFFTPGMQAMITGGAVVGDKPAGYAPGQLIDAQPAGVSKE
jgi:aryl-alcohol dehydrogenase-like predicted oxidoreductase